MLGKLAVVALMMQVECGMLDGEDPIGQVTLAVYTSTWDDLVYGRVSFQERTGVTSESIDKLWEGSVRHKIQFDGRWIFDKSKEQSLIENIYDPKDVEAGTKEHSWGAQSKEVDSRIVYRQGFATVYYTPLSGYLGLQARDKSEVMVNDLHNLGLGGRNNEQLPEIIIADALACRRGLSCKVEAFVEVADQKCVAYSILNSSGALGAKYWLCPDKGGYPVKYVVYALDGGYAEVQQRIEQLDGKWFPKVILRLDSAPSLGRKIAFRRIEVTKYDFVKRPAPADFAIQCAAGTELYTAYPTVKGRKYDKGKPFVFDCVAEMSRYADRKPESLGDSNGGFISNKAVSVGKGDNTLLIAIGGIAMLAFALFAFLRWKRLSGI